MSPAAWKSALAAGLALSADLLTKSWASTALPPHRSVPVAGEFFRLTLGANPGIAFGLLGGGGAGVLVLTGAVILVLSVWVVRSLRAGTLPEPGAWAACAVLGSAVANFADRLANGAVTDFLDVGIGSARWPTFNLADTAIVLGAVALALTSSHPSRPEDDHG
ncbi:MAG: signal peptidase II [Longimicrobiaceae bacterium]